MPTESAMIHVLWQFVVKAPDLGRFEQAYGPDGDWARVFRRYPGFSGTTLLRDPARPRTYITIDAWDSREQRDAMLSGAIADYARLDAACAEWTESERELGVFDAVI